MEDFLEELIQDEIVDETDVYVHNMARNQLLAGADTGSRGAAPAEPVASVAPVEVAPAAPAMSEYEKYLASRGAAPFACCALCLHAYTCASSCVLHVYTQVPLSPPAALPRRRRHLRAAAALPARAADAHRRRGRQRVSRAAVEQTPRLTCPRPVRPPLRSVGVCYR